MKRARRVLTSLVADHVYTTERAQPVPGDTEARLQMRLAASQALNMPPRDPRFYKCVRPPRASQDTPTTLPRGARHRVRVHCTRFRRTRAATRRLRLATRRLRRAAVPATFAPRCLRRLRPATPHARAQHTHSHHAYPRLCVRPEREAEWQDSSPVWSRYIPEYGISGDMSCVGQSEEHVRRPTLCVSRSRTPRPMGSSHPFLPMRPSLVSQSRPPRHLGSSPRLCCPPCLVTPLVLPSLLAHPEVTRSTPSAAEVRPRGNARPTSSPRAHGRVGARPL